MRRAALLVVFCVVCAAAWSVVTQLDGLAPLWLFRAASPHEEYARSLKRAKLHTSALGRDWLSAAERALAEPARIQLPQASTHEFANARADAQGYRFAARRGQRIKVHVDVTSGDARLFVDLFELDGVGRPRRVDALATDVVPGTYRIAYEVADDDTFIVRVQPELLRDAHVSIRHTAEPTMRFPVEGRTGRAVGSLFGDEREGGRRMHQGIDIFAPRGTRVLAATDGWVTGATTNRLGGNVVWIWDPSRGQVLYYAHLDKQEVATGERVHAGDLVGLVGNTGNARTTPPHLHFGIYRPILGAIDPLPFICEVPCRPRGMAYAPEDLK
jgi:murein DD-endopeptidase MepM/ murein hydrolase activator NlpD